MTRPLPTGKQSVKLAPDAAPGSRIRRDPPPAVKQKLEVAADERDQWAVIIGVVAFALAFFVIIFAFSGYSGWSPDNHTIVIETSE